MGLFLPYYPYGRDNALGHGTVPPSHLAVSSFPHSGRACPNRVHRPALLCNASFICFPPPWDSFCRHADGVPVGHNDDDGNQDDVGHIVSANNSDEEFVRRVVVVGDSVGDDDKVSNRVGDAFVYANGVGDAVRYALSFVDRHPDKLANDYADFVHHSDDIIWLVHVRHINRVSDGVRDDNDISNGYGDTVSHANGFSVVDAV